MPTPAESLTAASTPEATKSAVSSCIQQMMREGGRSQEQIIAICNSQARTSTGKELKKKGTRIGG